VAEQCPSHRWVVRATKRHPLRLHSLPHSSSTRASGPKQLPHPPSSSGGEWPSSAPHTDEWCAQPSGTPCASTLSLVARQLTLADPSSSPILHPAAVVPRRPTQAYNNGGHPHPPSSSGGAPPSHSSIQQWRPPPSSIQRRSLPQIQWAQCPIGGDELDPGSGRLRAGKSSYERGPPPDRLPSSSDPVSPMQGPLGHDELDLGESKRCCFKQAPRHQQRWRCPPPPKWHASPSDFGAVWMGSLGLSIGFLVLFSIWFTETGTWITIVQKT
jgi:hypothetical protein